MNGNDQLTQCALNNDAGNSAFVDTSVEVVADLVVFNQLGAEVLLFALPH